MTVIKSEKSVDAGYSVARCTEGIRAVEILAKSAPKVKEQWAARKVYWYEQLEFALARLGTVQEG